MFWIRAKFHGTLTLRDKGKQSRPVHSGLTFRTERWWNRLPVMPSWDSPLPLSFRSENSFGRKYRCFTFALTSASSVRARRRRSPDSKYLRKHVPILSLLSFYLGRARILALKQVTWTLLMPVPLSEMFLITSPVQRGFSYPDGIWKFLTIPVYERAICIQCTEVSFRIICPPSSRIILNSLDKCWWSSSNFSSLSCLLT